MPAKLFPADKLTHYLVGSLITLVALPFGAEVAGTVCLAAAVGREAYGAARGGEFGLGDLAVTLLGGAVVLGSAALGLGG